jgi:hypothetical protein
MAEKAPKKASKARAVKRAPAKRAAAAETSVKSRAKALPSKAGQKSAPAPVSRRGSAKPVPAPVVAEPIRGPRPVRRTTKAATTPARAVEAVAPVAAEPIRAPRPARRRRAPKVAAAPAPVLVAATAPEAPANALTEEELIESSKYEVREPKRPRRVFEEERFLFPETYDSDRVRLLVKDPEWLFAHWDVSPSTLQRLRDDLGERATALSRLTLRLEDTAASPVSVVLLPEGTRSWYVRTHAAHRAYRAALGVTMPSGEFRSLATSNVVVAPGGSPSPQRARRRVGFSRAQAAQAAAELEQRGAIGTNGGERKPAAQGAAEADSVDYIDGSAASSQSEQGAQRGGASDALGPGGASDVFRR